MKMKLKMLVAAVATSAAVMMTPAHAAGVPVFDVANINQMIVDYQNQIQQIRQMSEQLKAMTDNGNYAGILSDPTLRSYMNKDLPKGYNDIFEAAAKGDLKALQKVADEIKREDAAKANSMTGKARIEANRLLTRSQMKVSMSQLESDMGRIDSLMRQINHTANPAQKQDLANTIMAQSSMMQARAAQMQLMFQQAEAEDKAARAQYAAENRAKYRQMQNKQLQQALPNSLFNKRK